MDTGPAFYQIRVVGHLAARWAPYFAGLTLQRDANGDTVLWGLLPDQAALHGVLNLIGSLGLTLIALHRLDSRTG
jgi:hypothetical protein